MGTFNALTLTSCLLQTWLLTLWPYCQLGVGTCVWRGGGGKKGVTYRFYTVMHRYCFRGPMLPAPSQGGGENKCVRYGLELVTLPVGNPPSCTKGWGAGLGALGSSTLLRV